MSIGNCIAKICAAASLAVLCSCATLTPDECLYADWRGIGYEDGVQGRAPEFLSHHRQACAKVGVTPDVDAYRAGRDDGIDVFCRPANAYQLGREGYSYTGVCPDYSEGAFLAAYGDGLAVFRLESAVQEVVEGIAEHDYAIEDAERRIAKARRTLDENKTLTKEHRQRIRDDIAALLRSIGRMEAERDRLMVELGVRRERLREHLTRE